ncbi:glucosyl-3-phosphoglycerate synthase [Aciditerrimonas ferrireducens]|uniref:Glucosyl-3-phosphoglycerate synthase n=1 Tax=Aciditerrimonas ferrireducens TaxID=667306 RepID=A0ABV6C869_9ACTN
MTALPERPEVAPEPGPRRYPPPRHPLELERLALAKVGRRVSVVVPARDEAPTVGQVVRALEGLRRGSRSVPALVDEVLVVDDGSQDATAQVAEEAGAQVVRSPRPQGKGGAMRLGVAASSGDLCVFLDADLREFDPLIVAGLLRPLLEDRGVWLVKPRYDRTLGGRSGEGGRVTELTAKPLLALLFPELLAVDQPLAGETAAPRAVLETLGLAEGYAVEVALLIDVASRAGLEALAEVDLGRRVHRNRPLAELRPQAEEVARTILQRAALAGRPLG